MFTRLQKEEAEAIIAEVDPQTIKDIKEVQENVRNFALAQKACLKDLEVEIRPGIILGHKNVPIDTVGWYVIYPNCLRCTTGHKADMCPT